MKCGRPSLLALSTLLSGASAGLAQDLAIAKTGPQGVRPGDTIEYRIEVSNAGPSQVTGASLDDPTPPGLTFLSNAGACTTAFPCLLAPVDPGAPQVVTATYGVPALYSGPEIITNTATITAAGDPNPANDSSTAETALTRVSGYFTLPPCRVLDTRGQSGALGGPALLAAEVRGMKVRRRCGVPDNATAVSFNVTVTGATGAGDLRISPGGGPAPLASVINYVAGQTRANNGIVPLGPNGQISVQCDQASGFVHVIMDVNGYFADDDRVVTPTGLGVFLRPAPEVELTLDEVTTPGQTNVRVVEFPDNRVGDLGQNLRNFFPVGSPLRALLPNVLVPSYVKALPRDGPGGPPTFVLAIVRTTAGFSKTNLFRGLENLRLGWDPPCDVPADRTLEPRTFYAREAPRGEPTLVEELAFGGPVFTDISSGCGSNKGSGWSFSLYLTGRDTRAPVEVVRFKLQRMQDFITAAAPFISPPVAGLLQAELTAALGSLDTAPASTLGNLVALIEIVDSTPAAFDNSNRNVRGELKARAFSARYILKKLLPPGALAAFTIPTSASAPFGITSGPDGNLWFTERDGNNVGRITPGGVITEFPIPTPSRSQPTIITAGPDGNLWFVEFDAAQGNKIGRITTAGVITEFPIPTPASFPYGISAGPDGNLWFTETSSGKIGRITTDGVITEFPLPTAGTGPTEITAGADGNLWFTQGPGNRIGRITTSGVVTDFPLPTAGSNPIGITAGPDGNVWFTEAAGNRIGRITPAGVITEFTVPTPNSNPFSIVAGPDGNLWFTERTADKVGRIAPDGLITEFPAPPGSGPFGITAGPDGNLWLTEFGLNRIARARP